MQKLQQDFMEAQQQVQADADKAISELLEKQQSQRLLQIALRDNGLSVSLSRTSGRCPMAGEGAPEDYA